MKRVSTIFWRAAAFVGLVCGLMVEPASAHFDPPDQPAREDRIILTELIAKTDQDDPARANLP